MDNKNTFIALAYIRESDNPYLFLCNLILFFLSEAKTKSLRIDELVERFKKDYGLKLPYYMIDNCTTMLKNSGQITVDSNGCKLQKISSFDIDKFLVSQNDLKKQEEDMLSSISIFVAQYGIVWSNENSRKNLTEFLLSNENAYSLIVHDNIDIEDSEISSEETPVIIHPHWLLKKYIQHISTQKSSNYDYLIDILRGLMVLIGSQQKSDFEIKQKQKLAGTQFFLDTKLILRYLGYSFAAAVESIRELGIIIKDDYNASLCVFEHNIDEAKSALYKAYLDISNGRSMNYELSLYRDLHETEAEDFKTFSNSVRANLENDGIIILSSPDWNSSEVKDYNVDWDNLQKFIEKKEEHWNEFSITNDIKAIHQINVLRAENYKTLYGGDEKLPIFITSNYPLISHVRKFFINSNTMNNDDFYQWRLPLIADSRIICQLWIPLSDKYDNLPMLSLLRIAYSAHQSDIAFYEKIKAAAPKLLEKHKFNIVELSNERTDKFVDLMVKKTLGNIEKIDDEFITSSFPDFIAASVEEANANKNFEIQKLSVKNIKQSETISELHKQMVQSISKRFGKLNIFELMLIYISKFWWIAVAIIVSVSVFFVNKIMTAGVLIVAVLTKVFDKFLNRSEIERKVKHILVNKSRTRYLNRIETNLSEDEQQYKADVLSYCEQKYNAKYQIKQ